jgi:hypothetical protein
LLEEFLIEIHPIGQEHIGKGAPILVEAVGLERDLFPDGEFRGGVLGLLAVSPLSGQSIPLRRMRSTWWPFRTSIVSPSRTPTTVPVNVAATENEGTEVRVRVMMKRIEQDSLTTPVLDPAHTGACHVFINARRAMLIESGVPTFTGTPLVNSTRK